MITRLELTGFKSFQHSVLGLGPLTVLVGANASGKSNIRDAFRFLHGIARGYSLAEIFGGKWVEGAGYQQWVGLRGGIKEVAFAGAHQFGLTVDLEIEGHEARYSLTVEFAQNASSLRVVCESLKTRQNSRHVWDAIYDSDWPDDPPAQQGSPFIFIRLPRDNVNRKHGKRLQFLDSIPVLSQFCGHREAKKSFCETIENVISEMLSMQFLDLSPDAMRKPSTPGQSVLSDRGDNLSSVLQQIALDEQKKEILMHWITALTPMDVTDLKFEPDAAGNILLMLVEQGGWKTSAYSASDGTLRFLGMLAALLGPKPAKFYFVEELENGIHPTRQYLLLDLLELVTAGKQVQLVATTHSPQLLTFLQPESRQNVSLLYRLANQTGANIRRIMELPDVERVLESDTLGTLHSTGWLEDISSCLDVAAEDSQPSTEEVGT